METSSRELQRKVEELNEKIFDMENQLTESTQKYSEEKQRWEEQELSLRNGVAKQSTQSSDLQRQLEAVKKQYQQEIGSLK